MSEAGDWMAYEEAAKRKNPRVTMKADISDWNVCFAIKTISFCKDCFSMLISCTYHHDLHHTLTPQGYLATIVAMGFLQNFLNSIYGPKFYKEVPQKGLGRAFGYYFILALILTVATTLSLIMPVSNGVKEFTDKMVPQIVSKYPADLQVTVKNGTVSTNVKEPYFVPFPPGQKTGELENLLVIDTKTPFSDEAFEKYKTVAVLTKDSVYFKDEQKGEIRGNSLKELEDFTLNKQVIAGFMQNISPYFVYITPVLLFFIFLGLYIAYAFGLIQVAIIAFLLFLILKIVKPIMSYKDAMKLSLFGITFGLLLEALLSITEPMLHLHSFPYMTLLLTIAIVLINLKSPEK